MPALNTVAPMANISDC